ncbi:cell surface protein [Opitutaceae bacterium TAV5]|nr:cell surface protein [Opitutaceae bacterium TAV5]
MLTFRSAQVKRLIAILPVALCLMLAGCNLQVTNLTPEAIPDNPSRIFTFSARVNPGGGTIVPSSIKVRMVVDGQSFAMKPSELGKYVYEFDYQLPAGRDEVAYYYIVNYEVQDAGGKSHSREAYTDIVRSRIVGRYVLSLETSRGPAGARVSIVGRGFTPQDAVSFDGTPVQTAYESANSIAFYVPDVPAGRNYDVTIAGANGTSPVGTFRVDGDVSRSAPAGTTVQVSPTSLQLARGQSQNLTFILSSPAPAAGLTLDVLTDVPKSVIMPEVTIPAGSTSTTVKVEGGEPGAGSLYLKGFGSGEVTIPVTVR